MKMCTKCGEEKPSTEFTKDKYKSDGLSSQCRECKKAKCKKYYRKNREKQIKQCYANKRRRIEEHYIKLYKCLLEHPCVDCGESDPVVLEFDHLRDKTTEISKLINKGVGWERIMEEISKCEVRCANCHKIKTIRERDDVYKYDC